MSAKRKAFKVRLGNQHLTVSPWSHPVTGLERWRFAYRPEPGKPWTYRTFRTKAAATAEAERNLEAIQAGTQTLEDITPDRRRWLEEVNRRVRVDDQGRVLDFIRAMHRSGEITGAVGRFMASRISKAGEETPHLATLRGVLEAVAKHFKGRHVSDIHHPDLDDWFNARTAATGWKRKKDIRATLIQFWAWCRREGIAGPDATTAAERLPEIGGEHGERAILTPQQLHQLAGHISEEFRPWLVLGCFAGLRPEEIAPGPSKKSAKRGIHCEEIDFQFGVIRVAPEVSKVGFPRVVPMSDALRAWLQWAGIESGMTGPVCLHNPSQTQELARLGKLVFETGWPKDICRHSYGSYRNAQLRTLAQVAEEMGTSVSMLHRHYHNPQPASMGDLWFAQRPAPYQFCTNENGVQADSSNSPISAIA